MKAISLIAGSLIVALAASPVIVVAQTGAAVGAVAKTLMQVPPTTAVSAASRAAMVRAARTAIMKTAAGAVGAAGAGSAGSLSSVVGYFWTNGNGPVSNATMQLRNTVTGLVDASVKTTAEGQFVFTNVASGNYVVEYVGDSTKNLLALGQPFTVAPGDAAVATFMRMANPAAFIPPSVLSNTAASAVQAATTAGVTTVVSPQTVVTIAPPPPGPPPVGQAPPVVTIPPSMSSPIR